MFCLHTNVKTYIRSASDPTLFWYVTDSNPKSVYASSKQRTRFRVLAKDNRLLGKVIIPSDQIVITLARDSNAFVSSDNIGLIISPHPQDFSFSGLNGNFLAEGPTDTPVLYVPTGENWVNWVLVEYMIRVSVRDCTTLVLGLINQYDLRVRLRLWFCILSRMDWKHPLLCR
jgi:hypothetical protein